MKLFGAYSCAMGDGKRDILAGLLLCAALVIAVLAIVALPIAAHPPVRGSPVLVVAPPWSAGAEALVRKAGGQPLGPITAPFAVLADFPDTIPVDGLRQLGVWAVSDGRALAAICGVT